MNLWCPQCLSTKFSYEKINETELEGQAVIKDHMKCKNASCGYEFDIEWFEYLRAEWLRETSEHRFKLNKKKPFHKHTHSHTHTHTHTNKS